MNAIMNSFVQILVRVLIVVMAQPSLKLHVFLKGINVNHVSCGSFNFCCGGLIDPVAVH